MNSTDWLMLVAHLAYPRTLQPVQLQKALFLLDRKLAPGQKKMERIYGFEPYDYGPFDAKVYADAETLAALGLMSIQRLPGDSYRRYGATELGLARGKEVASQLHTPVVDYARSLVNWVQSLSFNQLVSAVYDEYPEMKAKSVFRG